MGLFSRKNHKMLGLSLTSKLDYGSCIISIAKIGALLLSMKLVSPEVALYLYKSTTWPCMEYCSYVWAGAPSCYMGMLDKPQKWIVRTGGRSLATSLEPLAYH